MQWFLGILVILVGVGFFIVNTPQQKGEEFQLSDSEVEQERVVPKTTENEPDEVLSGTSIDLSNQKLSETPSYVFERRDLTQLDLSNNDMTGALQSEIRQLSRLRALDLSNNQFTGVPAEVGQLTKLEELDLSNNQLTGLPHEIANLSNLRILDLRGNNPSEFDLNLIRGSLQSTTVLVD